VFATLDRRADGKQLLYTTINGFDLLAVDIDKGISVKNRAAAVHRATAVDELRLGSQP
jgi:hypothetical protein